MVEVFKTDVCDKWRAIYLIVLLYQYFHECRITFDLDDCDKVLRIEGENFQSDEVKIILSENGVLCEALE